MAGIMHFSRFYIFMESAEHAFFRSLGFSIHTDINGRHFGWPRIHTECEFHRPLRFEDDVEIRLLIREIKERTIWYEFVFTKLNTDPPEEVARGKVKTICVTFDPSKSIMKSAAIPEEIRSKLSEHNDNE